MAVRGPAIGHQPRFKASLTPTFSNSWFKASWTPRPSEIRGRANAKIAPTLWPTVTDTHQLWGLTKPAISRAFGSMFGHANLLAVGILLVQGGTRQPARNKFSV